MATVTVKAGVTYLTFSDYLTINEQPYNLAGCTVYFVIQRQKFIHSIPAVIDDAVAGEVHCDRWDDFPTEGEWFQEWQVVTAQGGKLTFPMGTYNTIRIIKGLG